MYQPPVPQQVPSFQPSAPPQVEWYYKKWFVVLMLVVFFPVGLILLWKSPVTKISGRILWTTFWALIIVTRITGGAESTPPESTKTTTTEGSNPAAPSSNPPPTTMPKEPAQPKDEFNYTVTEQDTGKVYRGKVISDVGFAVVDTRTTKTLGTNEFLQKKAGSGATFVVVTVFVKNGQKDAITMDGSLFKILVNGREYDYSIEGSTALEIGKSDSMFLRKINPDLNAVLEVPFEVPESIDLTKAQLQVRGGITGRTTTVPVTPVVQ